MKTMRKLIEYSAFLQCLLITAKPGEGDPQMLGDCNPLTKEDEAGALAGKQELVDYLAAANNEPLAYKTYVSLPDIKTCRKTVAGTLYQYTWTMEEYKIGCNKYDDLYDLCQQMLQAYPLNLKRRCQATYSVRYPEANEFKMGDCQN